MNPLLSAIRLYQRFISPLKGFRCAYHAHTGRQSCSHLGFRAVRRFGVLSGLAVLRQRLFLCGVAHRRYSPHRRPPLAQRGDCDVGCDLPCDILSNCGSCDWPERKRQDKDKERGVYLPPKNQRGG